jgi:hypothetical protein
MLISSKNTGVLVAGVVALANVWGPDPFSRAGAQAESQRAKSARGGALAKMARHQFEVFFHDPGLRVFSLDAAGAPLDAARLTATATFYHPNSPRPWFSRPLHPTAAAGQASSLDLSISLSKVPPSGAKVAFEVAGLADPAETTVTFTEPFEFVKSPSGSTATQPSVPAGAVSPGPRYVYGPGSYGYGFYRYPGPEAAPRSRRGPSVPLSGYGRIPSASPGSPLPFLSGGHAVSILPSTNGSNATVGPGHRDWTTGRDIPLAKPWLRPMD